MIHQPSYQIRKLRSIYFPVNKYTETLIEESHINSIWKIFSNIQIENVTKNGASDYIVKHVSNVCYRNDDNEITTSHYERALRRLANHFKYIYFFLTCMLFHPKICRNLSCTHTAPTQDLWTVSLVYNQLFSTLLAINSISSILLSEAWQHKFVNAYLNRSLTKELEMLAWCVARDIDGWNESFTDSFEALQVEFAQ